MIGVKLWIQEGIFFAVIYAYMHCVIEEESLKLSEVEGINFSAGFSKGMLNEGMLNGTRNRYAGCSWKPLKS